VAAISVPLPLGGGTPSSSSDCEILRCRQVAIQTGDDRFDRTPLLEHLEGPLVTDPRGILRSPSSISTFARFLLQALLAGKSAFVWPEIMPASSSATAIMLWIRKRPVGEGRDSQTGHNWCKGTEATFARSDPLDRQDVAMLGWLRDWLYPLLSVLALPAACLWAFRRLIIAWEAIHRTRDIAKLEMAIRKLYKDISALATPPLPEEGVPQRFPSKGVWRTLVTRRRR
jgi:hypothetical protein